LIIKPVAMFRMFFNRCFLLAWLSAGPCVYAFAPAADSIYHDYIVLSGGDTIKGKVLHLGAASIKIEPVTLAPPVTYRFGQVKEIAHEGVIYGPVISMIGDRKEIFAKRILHGRIDLFAHTIHGRYGDLIAYYAGKNGEMPVEVKTNGTWPKGLRSKRKRKDHLAALIADDKELAAAFAAKADYTFDDVTALVSRYNAGAAAITGRQ